MHPWIVGAAYAVDLGTLQAEAERRSAHEEPGAVEAWRHLLDAQLATFGPDDVRCAATWTELGRAIGRTDPEASRAAHERALELKRRALGPDAVDLAVDWTGIGVARAWSGESAAAVSALETALDLREAALGPEHVDVAKTLEMLARVRSTDPAAALPYWERAIAIRERPEGDRADLAATLAGYAGSLARAGRADQGIVQRERAVAVIEGATGPDSAALAPFLDDLAAALVDGGKLDRAREVLLRARRVLEQALGPKHPDLAPVWDRLGDLERASGDLLAARAAVERGLALRRAALGTRHADVASSLTTLARVLLAAGHLEEARAALTEALLIRRETLPEDHPEVATAEVNLGAVEWRLGAYVEARNRYEHALVVHERHSGPLDLKVAQILVNLGSLLGEQGDLVVARGLFERALLIQEAVLGPTHPTVGWTLANLATLAEREGAGDVLELRVRVVHLRETALGPEHPDLVPALTDLANVQRRQGDLEGARASVTRALSIAQTRLGPDHPSTATCWWHLGRLAAAEEDWAASGRAFAEAVRVRESALGPDHPLVAEALRGVARARLETGDVTGARSLHDRMRRIEQSRLTLLDAMSEREGLAYAAKARSVFDGWLASFTEPGDTLEAWEAWLVWRGAVSRRVRDRVAGARAPEAADAYAALVAARGERLQNERTARTAATAANLDERLRALVAEQERLERLLAETSEAWRTKTRIEEAGSEAVCASLAPGAVLVDLVRYTTPQWGARYDAFVVTSSCAVTRVALGDGSRIEGAVEQWLGALRSPSAATGRVDDRGAAVTDLVWAPLEALVPPGARLWIAPDGALAALPWVAMPVGSGYLLERNPVTVLPDPKDLLGGREEASAVGGLVVGGVDYGVGPGPVCFTGPVEALPGAAEEVAHVAAEWPRRLGALEVRTGARANEGDVRALAPGRALLHFATHGSFASSGCPELGRSTADAVVAMDPLLLSALALSGANAGGPAAEDGVLLARELADLDLRGTRWLVASACETGLGVATAGEGVQGLQRAAALAGAAQLVGALWAVPDRVTSDLMAGFYERLLDRRASGDAADALRGAQLAVLDDRRAATGEARPQDWGAFFVSGAAR